MKLIADIWHGSLFRYSNPLLWRLFLSYCSSTNKQANNYPFSFNIVNRGEWLWNPANIKGANKDFKIYVGRSTTKHNLLFCSHTLCMNYVTNAFLLVSSSVRSKQLLRFVHGQGQKREQKHTTKNFDEVHNHSPLLTMVSMWVALRVGLFKGH